MGTFSRPLVTRDTCNTAGLLTCDTLPLNLSLWHVTRVTELRFLHHCITPHLRCLHHCISWHVTRVPRVTRLHHKTFLDIDPHNEIFTVLNVTTAAAAPLLPLPRWHLEQWRLFKLFNSIHFYTYWLLPPDNMKTNLELPFHWTVEHK